MRRIWITFSALVLAAAAALASVTPVMAIDGSAGGSLSIENGRGVIQVRGRGVLVGRVVNGVVQIVDQTPADAWAPRINGAAGSKGKGMSVRGSEINFYIPGGRFKILVRGEGISISARGDGQVQLSTQPDATGAAGLIRVGDAEAHQLGAETLRFSYGESSSGPSGQVQSGASSNSGSGSRGKDQQGGGDSKESGDSKD